MRFAPAIVPETSTGDVTVATHFGSDCKHLKRILRLDRLRLRGARGAQDEFVLAAHS